MKRITVLSLLAVVAMVFAACAAPAPAPAPAAEATEAPAEEAMAEPTEAPAEEDAMAEATEAPAEEGDMAGMADIVDTAVAAGSFNTLATALTAAGLVDTLKGEGPFTVFAPTDDAFAALPEGTLDTLLADPQGALTDILLYHVVPGKVMAADVVGLDGQEVETVGGGMLTVTIGDDGSVMINDATVVTPDVEASNGVIHVIDSVLIPPSE
ncbi:MAG: fasciclin domain-containing protein [Caldilineaceae bacterium]